jgi:hypothetical protein
VRTRAEFGRSNGVDFASTTAIALRRGKSKMESWPPGGHRPHSRFGFWGPVPPYSTRTRRGSDISVGGCGCCLPISLMAVLGTGGRSMGGVAPPTIVGWPGPTVRSAAGPSQLLRPSLPACQSRDPQRPPTCRGGEVAARVAVGGRPPDTRQVVRVVRSVRFAAGVRREARLARSCDGQARCSQLSAVFTGTKFAALSWSITEP